MIDSNRVNGDFLSEIGRGIVESLIYLVSHLAHVEQHLIELEASMGKSIFVNIINEIRNQRSVIAKVLLDTLKLNAIGEGKVESLWCVIKHLSIALVQLDEVLEKFIKKYVDTGDKEFLDKIETLYSVRRKMFDQLMLIINASKSVTIETKCLEDICVETQEAIGKTP